MYTPRRTFWHTAHYAFLTLLYVVFIAWLIWNMFGKHPVDAMAPVICAEMTEQCLRERATHYAIIYGIDETIFEKVITCESQWKTTARGDSGKAYGLLQYWRATFERHAELCGLPDAEYQNPDDQLLVAACAFSKGYANEWTCWRRLAL